jgi:hypothetical protein
MEIKEAVRSLSLAVRAKMEGRGGYKVREGDGPREGMIVVGLTVGHDQEVFPDKHEGFLVVFLPLEKVH